MGERMSDFTLKFLDFPFSVETGEQVSSETEEEAEILDAYSLAVTNVVAKVGPAVVHIHVKKKARTRHGTNTHEREGSGSGVIITPDGYMVTNTHVVEGVSSPEVNLADSTSYTAELVGKDSATDLALFRVPGTGLPAALPGNSERLRVGQLAIAVGNPFGFQRYGDYGLGERNLTHNMGLCLGG